MDKDRLANLEALERGLGYSFKDKGLLDTALTHRSFMNENPNGSLQDNERLEFLGDAVLELCISDLLMRRYADHREGWLSRMRASVVNEQSLAQLAKKFRLGDFLLLGKGEESSGGRTKTSILSNAFEALVAAVYLDCGFPETYAFFERLFAPLVEAGNDLPFGDFKTSLQEVCQSRFKVIPKYSLIHEYGPDHDKVFQVKLVIPDVVTATGVGKTKKEAEQQAARKALDALADVPWEGEP